MEKGDRDGLENRGRISGNREKIADRWAQEDFQGHFPQFIGQIPEPCHWKTAWAKVCLLYKKRIFEKGQPYWRARLLVNPQQDVLIQRNASGLCPRLKRYGQAIACLIIAN